ncbi:hypothetical protein [Roseateles saccharophilus]|uniref:Cohesin domain-containing protein n=1 Tax=Roseateles saccharophilus TaxID=304 RepID=A0A4R3UQD3_ROSSA|nr:hypothetical protein [Roseateles saccharophilus]MDG0833525.1 hypothetical protein [Roseateles saccharophilus]TCU92548.1 hypothetical protein EV671_102262 [Roseateles saccharophilus]
MTAIIDKLLVRTLGALVLCTSALAARAAPTLSTPVTGVPGHSVDVVFDIDFGALTQMSSFQFSLDWDPSLLSLTGASETEGGAPFDALAQLSSYGILSTAQPGSPQLTATWFALDPVTFNPLPPLALTGVVAVDFTFDLAPGFPAGVSSPVTLALGWADETGFQPTAPQVQTTTSVSIASIPEAPVQGLTLTALWLLFWSRTRLRPRRG